ncbi:MAG: stage V sporulation protein AC [Lachnospiraceae bacterium]|nr:stage V sporulation protein AC [Lachnospiraceae bacterium]
MEKEKQVKEVLSAKNKTERDQKYNEYVKQVTPKHSCLKNTCNAFWTGGIICTIGQGLTYLYMSFGLDKENAVLYQIISLVFLSVLFTGLNLYPRIAKVAGAGSVVPITGFANSVAAPAIEYQKEGQVFGIGCKIFTIAGPVILYGIVSSWILGLIYYVLGLLGIV